MSTSATTVGCHVRQWRIYVRDEYQKRHFSVNSRKGNCQREPLTLHYANVYRWRWLSSGQTFRSQLLCCMALETDALFFFFSFFFQQHIFLCVLLLLVSFPSPFSSTSSSFFSSPPSFHPSIDFLERPKDGFPQQQRVSAACADVLAYGLDRFYRRPIVIHFRVKSQREQHSDTPFASAIGVSFQMSINVQQQIRMTILPNSSKYQYKIKPVSTLCKKVSVFFYVDLVMSFAPCCA